MFFIEGGVTPHTFSYIPSEYPVVVSLMSTYIYLFIGKVDDRMVLLLYPAFYVFLGWAFYFSLKKFLGSKASFFFTFLLLSLQNVIRHSGRFEAGQADIVLGFFAFLCTTLVLIYLKNKNFRDLLLLQFFLAVTSLIKNDGISIVVMLECFIVFSVLKDRLNKRVLTSFIFLAPFIEWQLFKSSLKLPSAPSYIGGGLHFERISIIILEFGKEFLNITNWNFLWPVFFCSLFLLVFLKKTHNNAVLLNLLVCAQILVYMSVFLFTSPDPNFHIPNVANRAFLHIAPIALFAVAVNTAIIKGKLKHDKI